MLITLIINTPTTVFSGEPEPPDTEAPPITTEAIASMSYPSPADGLAVPIRPISTTPANPASTALMINTLIL